MAPDASSGGAAAARPERAYVTFLAGDGDYVKGVVGLVKGLRKVGAAYPVVAAVWPDVPEEHRRLLAAQGCVVREIEPLYPPHDGSEPPFARAYYVVNYSKLQFWQFVEYSKMIYLDADMQVFQNIDHLFDLPDGYFYAAPDCVCEEHGPPCPETLPWPETLLGPRPSFYFNGGMFMFEPNLCTYKSLLKCFNVTPPTAFAEQSMIVSQSQICLVFEQRTWTVAAPEPSDGGYVSRGWPHPSLPRFSSATQSNWQRSFSQTSGISQILQQIWGFTGGGCRRFG